MEKNVFIFSLVVVNALQINISQVSKYLIYILIRHISNTDIYDKHLFMFYNLIHLEELILFEIWLKSKLEST